MTLTTRGFLAGITLVALSACESSLPLSAKLEGCVTTSTGTVAFCERRDYPDLVTSGTAKLRSSNGSASAAGSARTTVFLSALVSATAASETRAKEIVSQVVINTSNDDFFATGPVVVSPESWAVSFEAQTPMAFNLAIESVNGRLALKSLEGTLSAIAGNGDAALENLGGDVSARTTNGSIEILLGGASWSGAGLKAEAGNGSLVFRAPANYSARFTLDAKNGSTQSDFPGGTTTSNGPTDSHYEVTLGSGGALLTGSAQNGNAELRRQ